MFRTARKIAGRAALAGVLAGYVAFVALPVGVAWAQHDGHNHDSHGHAPPPRAADPVPGKTKGPDHGAAGHGTPAAHGGDHGGGHHGPGHINWIYGLIGEKADLK